MGDRLRGSARGRLNFERITALRPDLILGLVSPIEEGQYWTLSQIAPTVVAPEGYGTFEMPWQEITRVVGRALGREQRSEELVREVEDQFAEARRDHPEFDGMTMVYSDWDLGGVYYPRSPDDSFFAAFSMLGFRMPQEIVSLVEDPEFPGSISAERLDLFDADVLVWSATSIPGEEGLRSRLAGNAIYQNLDVVRDGRVLFLEDPAPDEPSLLTGAISFSSVLSLPYALEELLPRLVAVVDADPETTPEPVP